ncbi:MAG: TSUP family transporter [Candidatus Accumulibacter sp.]|uniref:sulfite exporter TauE/SafE family protein n=1 Tax=Accumulibacter sp. TaxID=2053492 RepID=UPI0019F9B77C|nr:TSUP family transporter [Accumulibacter sp.]MBE2257863.1 TSUP family transporter [Paracoccaceae bacterium]MCB1941096.1 TSUP family transporter [Accumulibacter sp.]MCP5247185.1 TSUP family transporter [Accumulibacter sp.]
MLAAGIDHSLLLVLAGAALFAGFIDAVVGGGGLIQIPALFTALPNELPATLFGTNKFSSVFGTGNAAWRYARRVRMPWRTTLPAALAAFAFSYLGAAAVAWLPAAMLRPLILLLLVGAAAYTFGHRDFGSIHRPQHTGRHELAYALIVGAAIGFYDGFFGPGTGSFLIFLFIRFFGFDFLHASAASKVVNVATNVAALGFFIPHGHILPLAALVMAVCNVLGSLAGAHLALRHGSGFVRKVFLCVVGAFIVKFAHDTFA